MAIRSWLDRFAADVVRVENPTSREIDCTRILLSHPRQPVHFAKLEGGEAVGNLWSTRDRVAASLGIPNEQLLPKLMEAQVRPTDARVVESAPFLAQSTTDVDLRSLPIDDSSCDAALMLLVLTYLPDPAPAEGSRVPARCQTP